MAARGGLTGQRVTGRGADVQDRAAGAAPGDQPGVAAAPTTPSRGAATSLQTLFERLDFVYLPSRDVKTDIAHFTEALGGELVFAIEAFETRVAMIRLSDGPPALLLAGHLEGDQPVLVYRVTDLDSVVADLGARGVKVAARLEIPHGPVVELACPGPQRLALYQLTRPEVATRLAGRRDF